MCIDKEKGIRVPSDVALTRSTMMRTDMAQSYLIIWLTDGPYILSLEKVTKKLSGWYAKEEDFA